MLFKSDSQQMIKMRDFDYMDEELRIMQALK